MIRGHHISNYPSSWMIAIYQFSYTPMIWVLPSFRKSPICLQIRQSRQSTVSSNRTKLQTTWATVHFKPARTPKREKWTLMPNEQTSAEDENNFTCPRLVRTPITMKCFKFESDNLQTLRADEYVHATKVHNCEKLLDFKIKNRSSNAMIYCTFLGWLTP